MTISPLIRQFTVAASTQLGALSAGGTIALPGILLQQLRGNETSIQLDLHNGSWIGSVHGIAGIPSIFLPLLMQHRGRKFAFVLSSMFVVIGWIIIYFAENIDSLIAGECFHGLGSSSLLAVSLLSITELVQPKYRNVCLLLHGTVQIFGVSLIGILGRYMCWKTVSVIMCCPIVLALLIGCVWPESPSWLAYKGKFEDCQRAFEKLRGTDKESIKELNSLIMSQKEKNIIKSQNNLIHYVLETIVRKDFYVPALHAFVLINVLYWGGGMPVIVYSTDMILKLSGKTNAHMKFIMDCTYFPGYMISSIIVRYCSSKKLMVLSMSGCAVFMTLAAIISYLQSIETMSNDSEFGVYCLVGFVVFYSLGYAGIGFSTANEIIPVKHRGIGGCFLVIYISVLHTASLKTYPYLCVYIQMWGVFSVYATYMLLSILFIWRYVPETRNRTLLEIEEFYNHGYFKDGKTSRSVSEPFIKSESC